MNTKKYIECWTGKVNCLLPIVKVSVAKESRVVFFNNCLLDTESQTSYFSDIVIKKLNYNEINPSIREYEDISLFMKEVFTANVKFSDYYET